VKNQFDIDSHYLVPSVQESEPYTYGNNLDHYHSFTIGEENPEYPLVLLLAGATNGDAYDNPKIEPVINKPVEAVTTSDDFRTWDYCTDVTLEPMNVWDLNGTAVWTTDATISYCLPNMLLAFRCEPLKEDGKEYHLAGVATMSTFDLYSETEDEESGIIERAYVCSNLNGMYEGTLDMTSQADDFITYFVTVPCIRGFSYSTEIADGYIAIPQAYVLMVYMSEDDDIIYRAQPIKIKNLT
jgi:hypothetical protein